MFPGTNADFDVTEKTWDLRKKNSIIPQIKL